MSEPIIDPQIARARQLMSEGRNAEADAVLEVAQAEHNERLAKLSESIRTIKQIGAAFSS